MKDIPDVKKRLIFALDVQTLDEVNKWVDLLKDTVGLFKIGKELFTSCGPDAVRAVHNQGGSVFLDLKFHDIPNTVAKASISALRLGVEMFNIHSLGGTKMMEAARRAVDAECGKTGTARPMVLAVTILTSMGEADLKSVGIGGPLDERVVSLALLARESGLDGVVASPREVRLLRERLDNGMMIVTPGIRPAGASKEDQQRTTTPREAISNGSDYIVVGRPIRESKDPVSTAEDILSDIEKAL